MGGLLKTMQLIQATAAATITAAYEVYARQVPEHEAMTQEDFAKEVARVVRERVKNAPDKDE